MFDKKLWTKKYIESGANKLAKQRYYIKHKDTISEANKRWILEHKEQHDNYKKAYRKSMSNKESQKKYRNNNKAKIQAKNKRRYIENKEKISKYCFNHALKRKYGITLEQREQMKIAQNNKCAICGESLSGIRNCQVDHNHITGKIRQLLCRRCNLVLGQIKENYYIADKISEYIKKWSEA